MLGNRKLVVDVFGEVYDLLLPYADEEFYDFKLHTICPGAIYLIGRAQFNSNKDHIRKLVESNTIKVILCNPAEGSQTLADHCKSVHLCADLVHQNKILLVGGGDMDPSWPYIQYDSFLPKIQDYEENLQAMARSQEIYTKTNKPYRFLFLNGRLRPHRKALIDNLRVRGMLDHALWTNLSSRVEMAFTSQLKTFKTEPIRLLPPEYEIERAVPQQTLVSESGFVKHLLFNNTWGDAIVNHRCYTDTWFSVVTETIFDYPHTFRTEKIWKPILMAHPFVVAANQGYLKDLRAAGFQTFHTLIDERYDQIDCPRTRIERIIDTVRGISQMGAAEFWEASRDICKYNQQHLVEYNREQRAQLPRNLLDYINERS
jgi:hypothetical protein